MNLIRVAVVSSLAVLFAGCGAAAKSSPDLGGAPDLAEANPLFAARPYTDALYVPPSYDAQKPTPLVILMHGYGFNGEIQETYFNLKAAADAHTFLYVYPTGTIETAGMMKTFWNATDACCNFYGSDVDDSAYLDAIITDVSQHYNVDAKRVYLIGHSNGAFMAHRMACDHASRIAAIVSLAGATYSDMANCAAATPVSVLQVHGDADASINYDGGTLAAAYPSAKQTVTSWGAKNGCSGALAATSTALDLDTGLTGAETTVDAVSGCPAGIGVELWTIHGGIHIPALQSNPAISPSWAELVWAWFAAHPKP